MTGVRSFDIKAYDDAFAGYVDLGWGDDIRINGTGTTPFHLGRPPTRRRRRTPTMDDSQWDVIDTQ